MEIYVKLSLLLDFRDCYTEQHPVSLGFVKDLCHSELNIVLTGGLINQPV